MLKNEYKSQYSEITDEIDEKVFEDILEGELTDIEITEKEIIEAINLVGCRKHGKYINFEMFMKLYTFTKTLCVERQKSIFVYDFYTDSSDVLKLHFVDITLYKTKV